MQNSIMLDGKGFYQSNFEPDDYNMEHSKSSKTQESLDPSGVAADPVDSYSTGSVPATDIFGSITGANSSILASLAVLSKTPTVTSNICA